MLTLSVNTRQKGETPDEVRRSGRIPAVYYGPKEQATPIAIPARELEHVWKQAGHTSVVQLTGVGDTKDSLIHDVQLHPVTGQVLHADFYVLEKGKKIQISVPLEFVGQSPAEKAGNIVVKALHEIAIEVAPIELPHTLPVDISKLENVGDRILARDIVLPPSASLKTNAEEIVALVNEFKEEKEEAPAPVVPAEIIGAAEPAAEAPAAE